jgi:hypothetical protein
VNNGRSTTMYATWLKTYFAGFMHDKRVAEVCFYKPVTEVVVRGQRRDRECGRGGSETMKISSLLRSFLALFLPTPRPEEVLTPEERIKVGRAWDEVFARCASKRRTISKQETF